MQSYPFFYYQGIPMQQNVPNVPIPDLRMPSVQQGAPMPMVMPSSSMEHQHHHLLLDEDSRQNKRYELISVLYNNLNIKKISQINKKMYFILQRKKNLYMYSNTPHRKIHSKG